MHKKEIKDQRTSSDTAFIVDTCEKSQKGNAPSYFISVIYWDRWSTHLHLPIQFLFYEYWSIKSPRPIYGQFSY